VTVCAEVGVGAMTTTRGARNARTQHAARFPRQPLVGGAYI